MAKLGRKRGDTSVMLRVFIQDNTSTKGAGKTGLTNASTNLNIATMRELDATATVYAGANIEAQTTIGAYQAPSTSAKIRFKEVDATNLPGVYELHFHNSAAGAFGSGDASRYMMVYICEVTTTALNIAPLPTEVELTAVDAQSTGFGLVNASANAVQILGTAISTPATAGILDVNVKNIVNTAAAVDANNLLKVDVEDWKAGIVPAVNVTGVPLIDLKYTLGTISPATAGSVRADAVTGAVGSVTGGVTVTTNNDKTGYSLSSAAVQAIWDALTSALTTVGSIGKLIVDNLNATISSRMATYTQPTGFLAATFPTGTIASTTNITGGTITTVTTLTGHTPQTGDTYALANGANGFSAIKADTAAILVDTGTTLDVRIPAALTAAGNMKADTLAISGSVPAADTIERTLLAAVEVTVGAASTTTSIVTSSMLPAAAVTDQFKGRILTFDRNTTTANLRGQATDITASTAAGVLAVTALTTAPVSGDTGTVT